MSQEQLLSQLATLQRENVAIAQEVSALKAERDRLIGALQLVLPLPTPAELAQAEANVGGFRRLIDQIATELGSEPRSGGSC